MQRSQQRTTPHEKIIFSNPSSEKFWHLCTINVFISQFLNFSVRRHPFSDKDRLCRSKLWEYLQFKQRYWSHRILHVSPLGQRLWEIPPERGTGSSLYSSCHGNRSTMGSIHCDRRAGGDKADVDIWLGLTRTRAGTHLLIASRVDNTCLC